MGPKVETAERSSVGIEPPVKSFLWEFCIETRKLECDTGGHFTNYPIWSLPRTNPNVYILKNSLNYYVLIRIKHNLDSVLCIKCNSLLDTEKQAVVDAAAF